VELHAFVGLQANDQTVRVAFTRAAGEHPVRDRLESHDDLRGGAVHALSGA
jgi:hypothetical protein